MAYKERTYEEILAALERLLERHPYPDNQSIGENHHSFRQTVEAFRNKEEWAMTEMDFLIKFAKEWNDDPVEFLDRVLQGEVE